MDAQLARVRASYDRQGEREWQRLDGGAQARLEWLITGHLLAKHLPPPAPAVHLLDAGGGPGRYALELARLGYTVTLLDLSPGLLAVARQRLAEAEAALQQRVVAIVAGSITALPMGAAARFSVVLCLGGVLSHLPDPADRQRALGELRRVLPPGGLLILTAFNRLGGLRSAVQWPAAWAQLIPAYLDGGQGTLGPDALPVYAFWPEELAAEIAAAGLTVEALYGCQGLGAHLPEEQLLALMADPERWPLWRRLLLQTCTRPDLVGASNHLLIVARRPAVARE